MTCPEAPDRWVGFKMTMQALLVDEVRARDGRGRHNA